MLIVKGFANAMFILSLLNLYLTITIGIPGLSSVWSLRTTDSSISRYLLAHAGRGTLALSSSQYWLSISNSRSACKSSATNKIARTLASIGTLAVDPTRSDAKLLSSSSFARRRLLES